MSKIMVSLEERRLRSAFRRIVLAVMAGPLAAVTVEACGSESHAGAYAGDAATGIDRPRAVGGAEGDGEGDDGAQETGTDPCQAFFLDASVSDADRCGLLAYAPCGLPNGVRPAAGTACSFALSDCSNFCGDFYFSCAATGDSCDDGSVPEAGPITVECSLCPGVAGRRPAGLQPPRSNRAADAVSAVGQYFARVAHLEAASVRAFLDLESELAEQRAPGSLLRHAARAARDEVRHARAMGRIARRFGGRPARVRVRARERRSLEAMARDNAIEGCVRETYGALLATWQATRAADPAVAAQLARIAEDETRHAALSWSIARWTGPRLNHSARLRLAAELRVAVEQLGHEIAPAPEAVVRVAGFPSVPLQRALFEAFERFIGPRIALV